MQFGSVGVSLEVVSFFIVEPMSMLTSHWDLNTVLVSDFADA